MRPQATPHSGCHHPRSPASGTLLRIWTAQHRSTDWRTGLALTACAKHG